LSKNFVEYVLDQYANSDEVIIDDASKNWLTKQDFKKKIDYWAERLPAQKSLIFCYVDNKVEHLAFTLACLHKNHCIGLLDHSLPKSSKDKLNQRYRPKYIFSDFGGFPTLDNFSKNDINIYPENFLMLSTSGSTGSPKFVVLSNDNVLHNALKISKILNICRDSVGSAYLPFHYSYGLSVITSHLVSGSKIALTKLSFMQSEFWKQIDELNVNHFPGVPFHYETLLKFGFQRLKLDKITTMTQAGGHLNKNQKDAVYNFMDQKGGSFFVMYGQTEASPRITTLKHEDFLQYPDSVGEVLEDGVLELDGGIKNSLGHDEGEILYEGPNVMLRYAENIKDLAKKPDQNRLIRTGDIGYIVNNRLFITGRVKRFAKIYGLRVNLDEMQKTLSNGSENIAVIEDQSKLIIFCEGDPSDQVDSSLKKTVLNKFTIPLNSIKIRFIEKLPVNSRGKIDYKSLSKI
jgi:acyl-CoA synthetase (AMP-forming)/AMP-acid ligase II